MLKHVNQAEGSSTCGQTSLAMLLGKTTEEVCNLMGKKAGTKTSDLIRVLDMESIRVKNRKLKIISKKNKLPKYAVLHLRPIKKIKEYWGHWSILYDEMVYDPGPYITCAMPLASYNKMNLGNGIKVVSFVELLMVD